MSIHDINQRYLSSAGSDLTEEELTGLDRAASDGDYGKDGDEIQRATGEIRRLRAQAAPSAAALLAYDEMCRATAAKHALFDVRMVFGLVRAVEALALVRGESALEPDALQALTLARELGLLGEVPASVSPAWYLIEWERRRTEGGEK